jgi:signal transduction histidine kinase
MTTSWRQYANSHPRILDAALIVLLLCAASGPAELNSSLPGTENLGWWSAVPLAVAACLALLWRRGHPRAVVVFTAVCVSAAGGVGYLVTPVLLAPLMVALYELAMRAPVRTARLYCAGVTSLIILSALLGDRYGNPWPLAIINPILFLLLPVVLGETARLRQAHRAEETRHHVEEERLRIARELHDVVAHHLALANAQAGTAAYLARTRSGQVEPILTELTGTTSAALRELKATVGLLRRPSDTDPDPCSPLAPAPGLRQLPELTAAFAASGLDVEVSVDGDEQPLSPGVDLAAFRIVQEALTNVTKHATTSTAHVRLAYGDDRLTITVTNTADPAADPVPPGEGFGLVGMRERARSAGGQFRAGPRPDGEFAVSTILPTRS